MQSYDDSLLSFCKTHSEESLYEASLLSAAYIRDGLGPDDIVGIHYDAVRNVASAEELSMTDRVRVLNDAHAFLLEVMIGYGAQYKEFLDLKLDEAQRRAESAERSEREKLEVLAMIAHELGNPLTVALGNMQIAARYLDTADITMIRSLVSDSKDALDSLAHLTSQIVAASRGEDLNLEIEALDLLEPVQKTRAWARRAAEDKQLSLNIPPWDEPIVVLADEPSVVSILNNLVSNAIRYTPSGGAITVTAGHDGDRAWVAVRDTGIGMSEEDQAHVFEKFFRGSQAKRMESRGLGMGMNIARRLAIAQQGELTIKSKPGEGSTFTFTLPLAQAEMSFSKQKGTNDNATH